MEYQLLSDALLVKLLRVDDRGAFEEIYRRYWKLIFKAAQYKLNDTEAIEELLQEVFLRLWEKRATQTIENLQAYLYTALKYQLIDQYKRQLLAEKHHDFLLAKSLVVQQSDDTSLDFQEIMCLFEQALQQLPEKTRQIFTLSRLEFKTTREISEALQMPERTIEYHITQSLKVLRVALKDFLPAATLLIFLS